MSRPPLKNGTMTEIRWVRSTMFHFEVACNKGRM